jgi:hypothetical protein
VVGVKEEEGIEGFDEDGVRAVVGLVEVVLHGEGSVRRFERTEERGGHTIIYKNDSA